MNIKAVHFLNEFMLRISTLQIRNKFENKLVNIFVYANERFRISKWNELVKFTTRIFCYSV